MKCIHSSSESVISGLRETITGGVFDLRMVGLSLTIWSFLHRILDQSSMANKNSMLFHNTRQDLFPTFPPLDTPGSCLTSCHSGSCCVCRAAWLRCGLDHCDAAPDTCHCSAGHVTRRRASVLAACGCTGRCILENK